VPGGPGPRADRDEGADTINDDDPYADILGDALNHYERTLRDSHGFADAVLAHNPDEPGDGSYPPDRDFDLPYLVTKGRDPFADLDALLGSDWQRRVIRKYLAAKYGP
jgi:hypothetical protein